jgi:hypothetical protein
MCKAEAAEYLSVSIRTLEGRRDIPRFQIGKEGGGAGKVFYRKSELDRWMDQHRVVNDEQQDLAKIAEEALQAVSFGKKSDQCAKARRLGARNKEANR